MKVSILITCYNSEDYIEKAIRSALTQKGDFELEILVGDDGSKDRTQDIVKSLTVQFPDTISLFVMPREKNEKSGFRAARNRINLLKHASGNYIAYLDGDDMYTCDTKIQQQLAILENQKYQKCSCCGHDTTLYYFDSKKKKDMIGTSISEGTIDPKVYWAKYYVHTNTILFRGEIKNYILENQFLDQFNDNYITFLLLQKGSMYYIPKTMAQYNLTGDGIWTGRGKVYGYIRNLLALDAEIKGNESFKIISMRRHLSDILYVYKMIKKTDESEIEDLVPYITKKKAPITYLIVCFGKLNRKEKLNRIKLYLWAKWNIVLIHFQRIPIYIARLFKKTGEKNE